MRNISRRVKNVEKWLNLNNDNDVVEWIVIGGKNLTMTKVESQKYLEVAKARGCYVGTNGDFTIIMPPELKDMEKQNVT